MSPPTPRPSGKTSRKSRETPMRGTGTQLAGALRAACKGAARTLEWSKAYGDRLPTLLDAASIPEADATAPPGLNALRARHPEVLAKPGPCAVLRVLLADPAMLWSARALAKSDAVRDVLPTGKADARSVGRWLGELCGAGLACAEGRGTAKRWRLGAA